ncbi:MAG TPA: hypothetical protein VFT22_02855, partial [Kofleriaceae bacterium]|nr:hypothetical protein [Kofleriaceae bacterium]
MTEPRKPGQTTTPIGATELADPEAPVARVGEGAEDAADTDAASEPGRRASDAGGATDATSQRARVRIARTLASPLGVLITLPALVAAVGLGILLVGRDA